MRIFRKHPKINLSLNKIIDLPKLIIKNNTRIFEKGFTLIEIIIVLSILALFAALAVPNVIRMRAGANEALAKSTLRSIANAIEMYAAANGNYPVQESDLLFPNNNPPYLSQSYNAQVIKGYLYNLQLGNAYTLTATPQNCGVTGKKIFTLQQNIITEVDCK